MKNKPFIPNFTQVPNFLFDDLLCELEKGELKVLLYIIRRTYGFQKNKDKISLSQIQNGIQTENEVLDRGTGLSRETIISSIERLEEINLIEVDRKNTTNSYSINIDYLASPTIRLVQPLDQTSLTIRPELVQPLDTQKKEKESIQNNAQKDLCEDISSEPEINEYLEFPLPEEWSDESFVDSEGNFIPKFSDRFGRAIKQSEITVLRKSFKAKKAHVRRENIEPDEVIILWNKFTTLGQNGVPGVASNPSCIRGILPEARLTPDIKAQIKKHAYKYKDIQDWEIAFKNYAKDIMNRWEDDKGYFKHRLSLYEFLVQKNGFIKFINR